MTVRELIVVDADGFGWEAATRLGLGPDRYATVIRGTGVVVHPDRTVGAWSVVGLGAPVRSDVPDGELWAGVPAA
jgi:hypothetical protein